MSILLNSAGCGLALLSLGYALLAKYRPFLFSTGLAGAALIALISLHKEPGLTTESSFMPLICAVLILFVCMWIGILDWTSYNTTVSRSRGANPVLVILVLSGYLLSLPSLGYYLASSLLIAVLSLLAGYRRVFLLYVIMGWCVFVFLFFERLLGVPLPTMDWSILS